MWGEVGAYAKARDMVSKFIPHIADKLGSMDWLNNEPEDRDE